MISTPPNGYSPVLGSIADADDEEDDFDIPAFHDDDRRGVGSMSMPQKSTQSANSGNELPAAPSSAASMERLSSTVSSASSVSASSISPLLKQLDAVYGEERAKFDQHRIGLDQRKRALLQQISAIDQQLDSLQQQTTLVEIRYLDCRQQLLRQLIARPQ